MTNKNEIKRVGRFTRYLYITIGILIMAVGYFFFINIQGLVTGGATGVGMIIHNYINLPLAYIIFIVDIVFLILAAIFLGKKIFIRNIYGSIIFPLAIYVYDLIFPNIKPLDNILLSAVYGGVLIGAGFGLIARFGGLSGGTDTLVRIVKKYTRLPFSICIYIVELSIIFIGAALSGVITNALYAFITVFISGKVTDKFIVFGNSKLAVNIISEHPNEIKEKIYQELGRGVTLVNSKGGYTNSDKTLIISIIQSQEYHDLHNIIAIVDSEAFVYVTSAVEIQGKWKEKVILDEE